MNRLEQIIQNIINIDKKKILYEPYLKIIKQSFNKEETPKHKKWKPLKEKRNKKIIYHHFEYIEQQWDAFQRVHPLVAG